MKITITEALAEVKLIKNKIEKKQAAVLTNLLRAEHLKDIYEAQGGSQVVNAQELQAISDLRVRHVKIRAAIAKANTEHTIVVGAREMTVNEWLAWKREVSTEELSFHTKIHTETRKTLSDMSSQLKGYKDDDGKVHMVKVLPNVDYGAALKKAEDIQSTLDALDGKLSLKNATVFVEV